MNEWATYIVFCPEWHLRDEDHPQVYVQQCARQSRDWKLFCLVEIPGQGGGSCKGFFFTPKCVRSQINYLSIL